MISVHIARSTIVCPFGTGDKSYRVAIDFCPHAWWRVDLNRSTPSVTGSGAGYSLSMTTPSGYWECRACGTRTTDQFHLSCTRQCPDCGEMALLTWTRGLTDPQSVPYKLWNIAYSASKPGAPKITTPPPGWVPDMSRVVVKPTLCLRK
jgi:hypothetical protein